tara:strand:- start:5034 stop:5327 length:294 start_codon:yes stop_codon:yes gene_type:complete
MNEEKKVKQFSNLGIWVQHPSKRKQLIWEKLVEGDVLEDKDLINKVKELSQKSPPYKIWKAGRLASGSKNCFEDYKQRTNKIFQQKEKDIVDKGEYK